MKLRSLANITAVFIAFLLSATLASAQAANGSQWLVGTRIVTVNVAADPFDTTKSIVSYTDGMGTSPSVSGDATSVQVNGTWTIGTNTAGVASTNGESNHEYKVKGGKLRYKTASGLWVVGRPVKEGPKAAPKLTVLNGHVQGTDSEDVETAPVQTPQIL